MTIGEQANQQPLEHGRWPTITLPDLLGDLGQHPALLQQARVRRRSSAGVRTSTMV